MGVSKYHPLLSSSCHHALRIFFFSKHKKVVNPHSKPLLNSRLILFLVQLQMQQWPQQQQRKPSWYYIIYHFHSSFLSFQDRGIFSSYLYVLRVILSVMRYWMPLGLRVRRSVNKHIQYSITQLECFLSFSSNDIINSKLRTMSSALSSLHIF